MRTPIHTTCTTLLLLAGLLLTVSCGPSSIRRSSVSPPPSAQGSSGQNERQQFYTTYMAALTASNAVYEETFKAIGRAKAVGMVQEAQLARWIEAGRKAELAIRTARDTLTFYLESTSGDPGAQSRVLIAISSVNAAIAALTQIQQGLGRVQ